MYRNPIKKHIFNNSADKYKIEDYPNTNQYAFDFNIF